MNRLRRFLNAFNLLRHAPPKVAARAPEPVTSHLYTVKATSRADPTDTLTAFLASARLGDEERVLAQAKIDALAQGVVSDVTLWDWQVTPGMRLRWSDARPGPRHLGGGR